MGDLGTLLAGIGGLLVGLAAVFTAVWTAVRTALAGSDRENETAATIALETAQQPDTITVKPNGEADER